MMRSIGGRGIIVVVSASSTTSAPAKPRTPTPTADIIVLQGSQNPQDDNRGNGYNSRQWYAACFAKRLSLMNIAQKMNVHSLSSQPLLRLKELNHSVSAL